MPATKNELMTSTRIKAVGGTRGLRVGRDHHSVLSRAGAPVGDPKAGQHHDDDDIGQRLDELGGDASALEPDLRRIEDPEQQSPQRRAGGRAAPEIKGRQRDKSPPSRDSLVEQADNADRQIGAGQAGHGAGEHRRYVADRQAATGRPRAPSPRRRRSRAASVPTACASARTSIAGTIAQANQVSASWRERIGAHNWNAVEKGDVQARKHHDPRRIIRAGNTVRCSSTGNARGPATATVKPRPTMISLARNRVITSDIARPTRAPIAPAATVASAALEVAAETSTATSAPASIIDSRPILTRPPIRLTNPPIAASRIGVVIMSAA